MNNMNNMTLRLTREPISFSVDPIDATAVSRPFAIATPSSLTQSSTDDLKKIEKQSEYTIGIGVHVGVHATE